MGTTGTPTIDLEKLKAEVAGMDTKSLEAELLKLKVRQKKQQAKMQGSPAQKAYQARQKELRKLLKTRAQELGIYDKINEQASAQAELELKQAATAVSTISDDEEEEEEVTA